jgi:hypothetical protein
MIFRINQEEQVVIGGNARVGRPNAATILRVDSMGGPGERGMHFEVWVDDKMVAMDNSLEAARERAWLLIVAEH